MLFHEMKSIRIHWVTTPLRVWTLKHKKEFVLGKVWFKIKKRYKLSHFWSGPSCSILWAGKTKHSFMGMEGKKKTAVNIPNIYIYFQNTSCVSLKKGCYLLKHGSFLMKLVVFHWKLVIFHGKNVVFHWKISLFLFFNIW